MAAAQDPGAVCLEGLGGGSGLWDSIAVIRDCGSFKLGNMVYGR